MMPVSDDIEADGLCRDVDQVPGTPVSDDIEEDGLCHYLNACVG